MLNAATPTVFGERTGMNIQHPVRGRVEEFRVQLAWRSCIKQALVSRL